MRATRLNLWYHQNDRLRLSIKAQGNMMERDWKSILVSENMTIHDVIHIIDNNATQIALVVDEDCRLLGSITDGDIRRGILRGLRMEAPLSLIMNRQPKTAEQSEPDEVVRQRMRELSIRHMPRVDENRTVVELVGLDKKSSQRVNLDNWVVIMVGGLGTRLRPLTHVAPKPMLQVGSKPILERILEELRSQGLTNVYLAVNYMADVIKDHFGDGSRHQMNIRYLDEQEPLGTAGALQLLPSIPDKPIIVMNGDLLTRMNFNYLKSFHDASYADLTICVREYDFKVPFGVPQFEGDRVISIDEKPIHRFFVNAGIYFMSPEVLNIVPHGIRSDMPNLINLMPDKGLKISAFPIREYWIDIGRPVDFEKAQRDLEME